MPDLNKISKNHIIALISANTSLSRKDSATLFDATLEVIMDALKHGVTVGLPGVGTLSVIETAARTTVHPGTADKIQIPAGKRVRYKVALDLKRSL